MGWLVMGGCLRGEGDLPLEFFRPVTGDELGIHRAQRWAFGKTGIGCVGTARGEYATGKVLKGELRRRSADSHDHQLARPGGVSGLDQARQLAPGQRRL